MTTESVCESFCVSLALEQAATAVADLCNELVHTDQYGTLRLRQRYNVILAWFSREQGDYVYYIDQAAGTYRRDPTRSVLFTGADHSMSGTDRADARMLMQSIKDGFNFRVRDLHCDSFSGMIQLELHKLLALYRGDYDDPKLTRLGRNPLKRQLECSEDMDDILTVPDPEEEEVIPDSQPSSPPGRSITELWDDYCAETQYS